MSALPLRPTRGAVLDALTVPGMHSAPPSFWADAPPGVRTAVAVGPRTISVAMPMQVLHWPLVTTDVAEAFELLQARDLIPLDYRGRFVCEACGGRGVGPTQTPLGEVVTPSCGHCDGTGHRPHPPTVAALASWASLGWAATDDGHPGIAGAEEWALAMVGVPAVWWRVGPVERDGVVPGRARSDLAAAGFGWSWNGRRPDGVTLTVPPLGSQP